MDVGRGDDCNRLSRVQGKSIKAICQELISRKVVRKVLRSDETEFRYERKHQPYPRMGAWREKLDESANAAKPPCSLHLKTIN